MDFRFTPEEEAFRKDVCEFLDRELRPEACEKFNSYNWEPETREFLRRLGERAWLCPSWPPEYGGIGASHMQRYILTGELVYRGGPYGGIGTAMAGPVIMMFGTDGQKSEYLPRIARAEIEFALGYTEPQAGSDLAALEIRAVEDGDYYIMNGQKVFNTCCHYADYHWLGARTETDPNVPKHKGISLFIVDMKSPGITIRPLYVMGGWRTNEVFYDNVRVPKRNLVGQLNRGFYHIAVALDLERSGPATGSQRHFEELAGYVKQIPRLAKDPRVRQKLAELATEVEVAHLLAHRVAWMTSQEIVPNYEASALKLFSSELNQRLANAGMQILGLYGQLQEGSKWAPLDGMVEWRYRDSVVYTIFAGTSEVQRNIIALRGLGMPRS
jgi:hypothetical protein